jgi:hypothetical protein
VTATASGVVADAPTETTAAAAPGPATASASAADDLALLRTYEPVVRYTSGELFFPSAVDGYLARTDLLVGSSERDRRVIAPVGTLTPENLGTFHAPPDETLYLRLVQKPLNGLELARWQRRPGRPEFKAPARLARVGLLARLIDAGFTASLLVRGTVPGGTAAAAQLKYAEAFAADKRYVYHGRVVRRDGWICLQYLFFYFMNDYRSTFAGVNDHEADWEQVFVYLEDVPDGPRPVWIAAAAHDYTGDELRRRWDDSYLELQGTHPVINAGGGSHASYFERGEYLTQAPIAGSRFLPGLLAAARSFWVGTLRQPDPGDLAHNLEQILSVPFIDYGRGDGVTLGPGGTAEWTPILIGDDTPWVDGYRGLFGLDTYDRFGGERAPAGPKYGRSGVVRQTWNDPLGFAGLDKTAPPFRQPEVLGQRIEQLTDERAKVETDLATKTTGTTSLDAEVRALSADGAMAALHKARAADLAIAESELSSLRRRHAALTDTILAATAELRRAKAGEAGDPRAHLHLDHHPVPTAETRYGRVIELWSAISVALLLLAVVGLIFIVKTTWIVAFLLGLVGYVLIESAFRRRLTNLLLRTTLLLAIVALALLAVQFANVLIVAVIVVFALIIFADNLREVAQI